MNESRRLRNFKQISVAKNNDNKTSKTKAQQIISWLTTHNGFDVNDKENSVYRIYHTPNVPIQVRFSNHGTYLWTWPDRNEYDPAHSINISIVVSEDGKVLNKDGKETDTNNDPHTVIDSNPRKRDFTVYQFVYNEQLLKDRDVESIYNSILNILKYRRYIDPLRQNERMAKPNELKSNYIVQDGNEKQTTNEGLYHQYELMYKLGCISKDLIEGMIHD